MRRWLRARPEAGNLGLGLATLALTFPVSILVARVLGPEGRGTYALVVMYSAIVALVAGGGYPDAAPSVVGARGATAAPWLERVLLRRAVAIGAGWAVLVAGVLFWRGSPGWLALGAASGAVTLLGAAWPFYLQVGAALGRVRVPAQAEAFRVAVYAAGALGLAATGWLTPVTATVAFAVSYLAGEVAVRRRLECFAGGGAGARTAADPADGADAVRMLGRTAMLGRLLEYAATRTDLLLVGALLGARAAGLYAVAIALTEPLILAANAAAAPVLAEVVRGDALRSRRFVVSRTGASLAVAALGALVIVIAAPWFVGLAFGAEFDGAVVPLRLLAAGYVLACGVRLLRTANIGLARLRENQLADAVAIGVLVAGDLLLLPAGGLAAAAAVTVVAMLGAFAVLALRLFVTAGAPLARLPRDA